MKFLFISKDGDGLGIAEQFARVGHDIRFWIKNTDLKRAGEGLVNRVPSWRPHLKWADLVVADMVGFGRLERAVSRAAENHLGFNPIGDMMELDRQKQMELLRRLKIPMPVTFTYDNVIEALDILEIWKDPGYVIKPSGNAPTSKTMVVRDKETFEWALDQQSSTDELVIQEIVEGIEISTEGWFDGKDWIPGLWNHTLEEKRLLDGNLGPNVGSMGNIVWGIPDVEKDTLALEVRKLAPALVAAGYVGPVDLNTIVAGGKPHALELTTRFGYDAIEALSELITPNALANVLWELGSGLKPMTAIPAGMFATAIRVTVPPYPFGEPDSKDAGLPVHIPANLRSHFYLTDCIASHNVLQWAAGDGVVCKVTGKHDTPNGASAIAYDRLARMEVQDMMYRQEIGLRAEHDIGQLHEWKVL